MALRKHFRPQAVVTLGLIALAVANIASYLVQRKLDVAQETADGVSGLLMGAAITTLLIGIWMRSRDPRSSAERV
jgi:hypothetical protein